MAHHTVKKCPRAQQLQCCPSLLTRKINNFTFDIVFMSIPFIYLFLSMNHILFFREVSPVLFDISVHFELQSSAIRCSPSPQISVAL